jgi:hypothetical protein
MPTFRVKTVSPAAIVKMLGVSRFYAPPFYLVQTSGLNRQEHGVSVPCGRQSMHGEPP